MRHLIYVCLAALLFSSVACNDKQNQRVTISVGVPEQPVDSAEITINEHSYTVVRGSK